MSEERQILSRFFTRALFVGVLAGILIGIFLAIVVKGSTTDAQKVASLTDTVRELERQRETITARERQTSDERNRLRNTLAQLEQTPTKPIGTTCSTAECLHSRQGEIEGIAKLRGYFTTVKKTAWDETADCSALVVIDGSRSMINYFVDLVDESNGINGKNNRGQLLLTINESDLDEQGQRLLRLSTEQRPIELTVLNPTHLGREVPVCFSFVQILKIEPASNTP